MRLELPEKKHEKEYLEMIQEFSNKKEDIIPQAAGIKEGKTYEDFLQRMQDNREGKNLKPWRVRSDLFLLIDDDGRIVWTEAIRRELNDALRFDGGNIGYGIRPSERRKGYATIWLKLALEKCKEAWLDKVLVNCRKDNIWSAKTIIKNCWIRDSEYEAEGHIKERYRIPIK